MSAAQRAQISKNKEAAVRRKQEKPSSQAPLSQIVGASASGGKTLSVTQKAQISKNREAAVRRKRGKVHGQVLDEDDPFGHGGGLDDE